ncbi:unnamed protein product [Closterium sp. NIES-53]
MASLSLALSPARITSPASPAVLRRRSAAVATLRINAPVTVLPVSAKPSADSPLRQCHAATPFPSPLRLPHALRAPLAALSAALLPALPALADIAEDVAGAAEAGGAEGIPAVLVAAGAVAGAGAVFAGVKAYAYFQLQVRFSAVNRGLYLCSALHHHLDSCPARNTPMSCTHEFFLSRPSPPPSPHLPLPLPTSSSHIPFSLPSNASLYEWINQTAFNCHFPSPSSSPPPHLFQFLVARFVGRHVPRGGAVVLDFRAGSGRNIYYLPDDVDKLLAMQSDVQPSLLKQQAISSGVAIEVLPDGLTALNRIESASVDAVITVDGFKRLTPSEATTAAAGIARILKPNRPLIFVEACESGSPGVKDTTRPSFSFLPDVVLPLYEQVNYDYVLPTVDRHVVGVAVRSSDTVPASTSSSSKSSSASGFSSGRSGRKQ